MLLEKNIHELCFWNYMHINAAFNCKAFGSRPPSCILALVRLDSFYSMHTYLRDITFCEYPDTQIAVQQCFIDYLLYSNNSSLHDHFLMQMFFYKFLTWDLLASSEWCLEDLATCERKLWAISTRDERALGSASVKPASFIVAATADWSIDRYALLCSFAIVSLVGFP